VSGEEFGSAEQVLHHMADTHSVADLKKHCWSLWVLLRIKPGVLDEQKRLIQFHLNIEAVDPGPAESFVSARSSGHFANGGTPWKGVLGQNHPHIVLLN
jgi:hypothetical protein